MSTFKTTLVLGLLLLSNACTVGTVTGSTRVAGAGGGAGGGLGPIVEANSPPPRENPMFDRIANDRGHTGPRENVSFNLDSDCKRCR